ncbi:hypothetical protein [Actinosynnema sp. NPDC023587]|uniref:hypothetical protein n=1 Tax=Actinosynnema sp. NPDC023587 TaxID=3154695 RepID=UPI0033C63BF7
MRPYDRVVAGQTAKPTSIHLPTTARCAPISHAVFRVARRPERAGFVRRVPDPTGRRTTLVEPTAASEVPRHRVRRTREELEEGSVPAHGG